VGVPAGAHLALHSAPLAHVFFNALACFLWMAEKQWCYGVNWVVPLNRVAETNHNSIPGCLKFPLMHYDLFALI